MNWLVGLVGWLAGVNDTDTYQLCHVMILKFQQHLGSILGFYGWLNWNLPQQKS